MKILLNKPKKKTKIADEIKGPVEELFVLPHHPKHKSGSGVLSEIILPLLSAFKISRFITPLSMPSGVTWGLVRW